MDAITVRSSMITCVLCPTLHKRGLPGVSRGSADCELSGAYSADLWTQVTWILAPSAWWAQVLLRIGVEETAPRQHGVQTRGLSHDHVMSMFHARNEDVKKLLDGFERCEGKLGSYGSFLEFLYGTGR